jgi:formate dehydrogenase major subunit
VAAYTNAPFIVGYSYGFKDGLFSGLMPKQGSMTEKCGGLSKMKKGNPKKDRDPAAPRCVLQLLKQHYSGMT